MHDYGFRASLPAYGPLVLRLALAAIFVGDGAQKLFGMWGGAGLTGTAAQFAAAGVEPGYPLAVTSGIVQFAGGLLLIIGALTLPATIALSVLILGGIWQLGHGSEYYLVLLTALISLMLTGPGAFSIDGRRAESARAEAAGRARLRSGNV